MKIQEAQKNTLSFFPPRKIYLNDGTKFKIFGWWDIPSEEELEQVNNFFEP